ncbi:GNAT family N-acetyltransferase [Paenibacillaceae bacterium WGS1546]|uniref:GNAT family N-acetyltransferase n=1 Tax=Cohnella sp. WGS1546 TaxID=3366810 RepID=UPI00372D6AD0
MHTIKIKRPTFEDREALSRFFRVVVTDTFEKEGIGHLREDRENEISDKIAFLDTDLNSNGQARFFYIAEKEGRIVGTIEHGPANALIREGSGGALKNDTEVGTVFVHPGEQGRGIGSLLVNVMALTLRTKGFERFCLDSGYASAQRTWTKKFGEPDFVLRNYWGEGGDHKIWTVRLSELSIEFKV